MTQTEILPAAATPKLRSLLWLLASVQLTLLLDFMVMMPLGPELMRALNLTASHFGLLVSAYTLASAVLGFSGFFWLDRFDRSRTLLALYAGFILATLTCGVAGQAHWLLAARVLSGACAGLLWAVIMAVIVDVVPERQRGSAMGLVMTSYAISAVAGVPLGLFVSSVWGWRAPFLLIAAVASLLWLELRRRLRTLPSVAPRGGTARAGSIFGELRSAPLLGWLLTLLVVSAGFLLIPYLSTFMVNNLGLSSRQLPWVYLCGGGVTFFSSRLVGYLVDRFGPAPVLACLLVATVGPHLWFTHLRQASLPGAIAAFVAFMTLTSGRMIPTMVLLASRVPGSVRARYLAVNTAMSDAGSGLASWVSGMLLGTGAGGALVGFERLGWLAVAVTLSALLVLWRLAAAPSTEPSEVGAPEAEYGGST